MADPLDAAAVRHVAKLARLALSEEEVAAFATDLTSILTWFEQLQTIDTTDVEPLAHPLSVTNVLRDDVPRAGLGTEAVLANAPQRAESLFRVPKVLDQGA